MNDEGLGRLAELTEGLPRGWLFFRLEIAKRIQTLTEQLVNANDEETRGRIKALISVLDLPDTLDQERRDLSAALSEQDAAS